MYIYPEISQSQIETFKPTRLYIKLHTKTDLLYFGKSIREDLDVYKGSGSYWKNHLKTYGGKHVVTLWVSKWFHDPYELQKFALAFSREKDIVNVKDDYGHKIWANLKEEDGLNFGGGYSDQSKEKQKQIRQSDEYKNKYSYTCPHCNKVEVAGNYWRYHDDNCKENPNRSNKSIEKEKLTKKRQSLAKKKETESDDRYITCIHCGESTIVSVYSRWHGDNCSKNPNPSNDVIEKREAERCNKFKKIVQSSILCPYCNKIFNRLTYGRWHGDNCSKNNNRMS